MTEKKGFLNFIKGFAGSDDVAVEDDVIPTFSRESEEGLDVAPEDDRESIVTEEIQRFCVDRLSESLTMAGMSSEVRIQRVEYDRLYLEIINEEDLGRLIGKDGATLESWQVLVRTMMYKEYKQPIRLILDAGEYRKRKMDSLRSIAMRAARKVVHTRGSVELRAMSASERRFVHLLIKKDKRVVSNSVGEGSNRHIVLEYAESVDAG